MYIFVHTKLFAKKKPVGRCHEVLHTFYKNQFRKKLKRMMEGTLVKFRISKVTPSLSYAAELSRQHFPFPTNTRVYVQESLDFNLLG